MTKIITKKHFKELSQDEKQMNVIISRIRTAKENVAKNILELGKQLYLAKQLVAHGDWEKWLEEKVEFSQRTANRFMRCANEFSNSTSVSNLGSNKLFKLLDMPKEDREDFISKPHEINGQTKTVDEMTTRELKEVIKENKKSKKNHKKLQT
ncbi:DUF3102 domain-containing protein [Clostridium botulinum]|uniref:DUF3102 domain-containing protein n=1 Tax=Clostridium botulinum TaxID=1491 RepID=UPI0022457BE0|nr:DUF3102 domain-containing protein [Clostridium botulinum]UZP04858.1 DUF3102 domain-containing protein [Clostridium botulinum]UZP08269.1 DUF3102 domain-containing protein [Clostridium botulinum]UZP11597.1 DUF3102 domain-containing protein [Clostridium botulinum]